MRLPRQALLMPAWLRDRVLAASASRTRAAVCLAALLLLGAGGSPGRRDTTVRRVIDGDTIQLSDGRLVRYIGIDTPESRRLEGGEWIEDPEPFAAEATDANRAMVAGQAVRLEYDVERLDRHGRTLAYVYAGDRMVNEALVEAGFATVMTIPPNVRYAERFRAAAAEARRQGRGLWQASGRGRGTPAIPAAGGTSGTAGR